MNATACPTCRKPLLAGKPCPTCANGSQSLSKTVPSAPAATDAPDRLGQYRVLRELGRGGMGRVLEAVDEPLGRHVAVKMLLPGKDRDISRKRFIDEARIAGCLEHPGIAPIYNLGRAADGSTFFSMKLVAGRDLSEILSARQTDRNVLRELPLSRLLSLFERVVETVAYAHSQNILHRDLKPANIMVGEHGEVWVLDWGLAKTLGRHDPEPAAPAPSVPQPAAPADRELTSAGAIIGTPQYMAPEQAKGQALDIRTDVYALGGILYKMLTGEAPNQGEDSMGTLMNAALGAVVPVRSTKAGRRAPAVVASIAMKCLAVQPDDRYARAEDLLADLRAYAAGEAVKAHPDRLLGKLLRLTVRHYRLAIAAGTTMALFLVGATLAATSIAAHDRHALDAERHALDAERHAKSVETESAARAQRHMRAFTPYAEAADLLMRGQLPLRAVELLEQALQIDPEFSEAQFALGEAFRLSGQPGKAAPAYLQANELSQKITGKPHVQALLAAGMTFDGAGDYKLAEQTFLRAESAAPDHPLTLVGKTFRLAEAERVKEARAAADQAVALAPHLWETQFAQGYILMKEVDQGFVAPGPNMRQGIRLMRKALELSPRQAETCFWLAHGLFATGAAEDRAEALRWLDRAVELEPSNGNRYARRGLDRLRLGDPHAAEDFKQARALKASPMMILNMEAQQAALRGERETAFRLYGELLAAKDDWPAQVHQWLIQGYVLRRDTEIQDRFEEWYRQNPEYPEVYCFKAVLKARSGDHAAAAAEARQGLKLAPFHRQLRIQLASQLYFLHHYKEALPASEAALEVAPHDYSPLFVRAYSLCSLGRKDEGRALFQQMKKDFPTHAKDIDDTISKVDTASK